jgi:septum site-determining protein MinC
MSFSLLDSPTRQIACRCMTSDSAQHTQVPTVSQNDSAVNCQVQVRLKSEGERLLLILPPEAETPGAANWFDLWQQLKQRLNAGDRFWQANTIVHLMAQDRLLDGQKLQAIADALSEVQLQLVRVFTTRRQTAVAAAAAGYSVEQQPPTLSLTQQSSEPAELLAEPLYLQLTVRSGMEIHHPGTIVILGDLNPGSSVVAAGDIFVWGRLRGVAHAGANGNRNCRIMALQMEPTQLRIADAVARAPETPPYQFYPEVAYVAPEGIRIARAADFAKTNSLLNS